MSKLTDEDKVRLNRYTDKDMQFKDLSGGEGDRHTVINLGRQKVETSLRQAGKNDRITRIYKRAKERGKGNKNSLINSEKRIKELRDKRNLNKKETEELIGLTEEIYKEERAIGKLEEKYESVDKVNVLDAIYMSYASEKGNRRKELQEYGAEVLFHDEKTGIVIIKQTSGNPEEKAINEYYSNKYSKNIGESTEGSAILPISEIKRMISNGEIISYGGGLLTGYGITEKDAKINYEVRNNALNAGLVETALSGYRVIKGTGLVSTASGCTVVTSGGCSLIATGVGTVGYTEILFGANDLISGLGTVNNALMNRRDSGYNATNEYIRYLITRGVRQTNVSEGFNPLREGIKGLQLPDWVYTSANSASFVASAGAESYKKLLTPISKYVFEENLRRTENNWQTESTKYNVVKTPNGDYKLGIPSNLDSSTVYNFNNGTAKVEINYGIRNLEHIISNRTKLYTVVPEMGEMDESRGTLINGSYIKNPSAKNITEYVNETNYLGTGGKKGALNGQYMYVIDSKGDITIGKRMRGFNGINDGLPHPTLIGGVNPKVQGAGIVNIQGGKIYKIDNASGHFRPSSESLKKAEEFFFKNVPDKYYSKDFQGFQTYDDK